MASTRHRIVVLFLLAFFLVGASIMAFVRPPHEDEGHFANAAVEFARHGRLAMPMWTEWVPSLDRCMFVTMPFYFMQLGIWAQLFGDSIAVLRLNSVAWGILLVLSWFGILRQLSADGVTPLLGLVLIAGNYDVMNVSSGRYDPNVAALNALGIFLYLYWRESNLRRAVLAANVCLALACITHPYAIFGIAGFTIFFLFLDRGRFSFGLAALAAVPYLVALGGWGIYIAQYPDEFRMQMGANSAGRLRDVAHPLQALWSDLTLRYIVGFSGFRPGVPVYMWIKILLLAAYAAGFAACLLIPQIRHNTKMIALVAYGCVSYLLLAFGDGYRWYIYLIHVVPVYSAVLAVALGYFYKAYARLRGPVIAMVGLFVLYSAATVGYRMRNNEYANIYLATLHFLRDTVQPGELVMGGSGEFGPGLQYRDHILADRQLGYKNRLTPDLIVADNEFRELLRATERANPDLHRYLTGLLANYDLVFSSPKGANPYEVYRRRTSGGKPV